MSRPIITPESPVGRDDRDEGGRCFSGDKSESVGVPTVELLEDEKVRHPSSNPASYWEFRVNYDLARYFGRPAHHVLGVGSGQGGGPEIRLFSGGINHLRRSHFFPCGAGGCICGQRRFGGNVRKEP